MKEGDFVICFGDGLHIGQISTEVNSDGEFDLDFIGGGSVSPGNLEENIVVSEDMARFFAACVASIPSDPEDEERLFFTEEIISTYFKRSSVI